MGYAAANGFAVTRIGFQPVKGPEGNIEYLMSVQKSGEPFRAGRQRCRAGGGGKPQHADPLSGSAIRPEKGASRMTIYISPNPGKTSANDRTARGADSHEPWCSCSDV